jgi:LuxR family quorum sensing-dependent transcriptional regulator
MAPVYAASGLTILDEVREFGLSDGLTSSFHLTDGTVFGITLGTPNYDLDPTARTSILLASAYCGTKLAECLHWPLREPIPLSLRERECICWVATGKTDWEISEILGISQQTVHKHVSNALKKLGAGTRAHAVAIALSSRLIAL